MKEMWQIHNYLIRTKVGLNPITGYMLMNTIQHNIKTINEMFVWVTKRAINK